ncbi:MAG: cytoplasmic protein [Deltaproteobacteria bacterium]|nr:cytoplasmic protein [Deltaproteobacteria bacterium]
MNPKSFANQPGAYAQQQDSSGAFKEFEATELYCPRCRRAVSVRKRLLLVIPEGDKYEYLCAFCSESVGTKIDRQTKPMSIIV